MSCHGKELRGALGRAPFGLCVNPSLVAGVSQPSSNVAREIRISQEPQTY